MRELEEGGVRERGSEPEMEEELERERDGDRGRVGQGDTNERRQQRA